MKFSELAIKILRIYADMKEHMLADGAALEALQAEYGYDAVESAVGELKRAFVFESIVEIDNGIVAPTMIKLSSTGRQLAARCAAGEV